MSRTYENAFPSLLAPRCTSSSISLIIRTAFNRSNYIIGFHGWVCVSSARQRRHWNLRSTADCIVDFQIHRLHFVLDVLPNSPCGRLVHQLWSYTYRELWSASTLNETKQSLIPLWNYSASKWHFKKDARHYIWKH